MARFLRRFTTSSASLPLGTVQLLGEGLYPRVYGVGLPKIGALPQEVAVLIPHDGAPEELADSLRKEIRVLQFLEREGFSLPFPRLVGTEEEGVLPILITEWLPGLHLGSKGFQLAPLEHVGCIARAAHVVHSLSRDRFQEVVPGADSCREFALGCLARYRTESEPAIIEALAWCDDHLPSDEPTVVLHGDLLGQNLLVSPEDEDLRVSVLDWTEACLGDPAYDFAIVTRAHRKPFKLAGGLQLLLDHYHALSARPVEAARVRLYEVILVMGWLVDHLKHKPLSGEIDQERIRLRKMIGGV